MVEMMVEAFSILLGRAINLWIYELESAVDGYFEHGDYSHYKQGIKPIEQCWKKCMELKRNYVEK